MPSNPSQVLMYSDIFSFIFVTYEHTTHIHRYVPKYINDTPSLHYVTYMYMSSGLTSCLGIADGSVLSKEDHFSALNISKLSIVLGVGLRPHELFSFPVSLSIAVFLILTI